MLNLNIVKLLMLVVMAVCFTGNIWAIELRDNDVLKDRRLTKPVVLNGNNIKIINCVFDMEDKDNKDINCIEVKSNLKTQIDNVLIENCDFKRVKQVHISALNGKNWKIINCRFEGTSNSSKWHGQSISVDTIEDWEIRDCVFRDIDGTGVIVVHYSGKNIKVENCAFVDCNVGNGIFVSLTNSKGVYNSIFRNCSVFNANKDFGDRCGVEFPSREGFKSEGNKVELCVWDDSGKITWGWTLRENNTVSDSKLAKDQIKKHPVGLQILSDLKVDSNTLAIVDARVNGRGYVPLNDPEDPVDPLPSPKKKGKILVLYEDGTYAYLEINN